MTISLLLALVVLGLWAFRSIWLGRCSLCGRLFVLNPSDRLVKGASWNIFRACFCSRCLPAKTRAQLAQMAAPDPYDQELEGL